MEKFLPLSQTDVAKIRHGNKSESAGCHYKQKTPHPAVVDQGSDANGNILQLYYAALIQYHSSDTINRNQDTSYLHCT
jgi:hypothetical protein